MTFNVTAPTYVSRAVALPLVRALLDSAAAQITAVPPSAFFNAQILTPGVSLPNLVQILRARYARMAGDDATAIAAANLVARSGSSAISAFTYPPPGVNPYSSVTGGTNGIAVRRQFRMSMNALDQRFVLLHDSINDAHRAHRSAARSVQQSLCRCRRDAACLFPRRGAVDQGGSAGKSG